MLPACHLISNRMRGILLLAGVQGQWLYYLLLGALGPERLLRVSLTRLS